MLGSLSVEDLNNANFPYNYECDIQTGHQIGLPTNWAFIKYFKHSNNNGFGVQIAYKLATNIEGFDTSEMWLCKMRISDGTTWQPWIEFHTSLTKENYSIDDANKAIENGKVYYCRYQHCKNLPYNDDGMIQVFSMNNGKNDRTVCFQMWYSWNNDCVCYRKCVWGNWSSWKRLATTNV